ncbi:hypothetical protein [Pectobacterium wasabiae]|uniref:Uncharacterized protein n=1 Tax=Pectobacterium wasabiae TaxID=55208 RepID=A0AAW3EEQ0_9GAMM|nr:hypothetical protein [Pectobacterium wasabiae]AOR62786.1 hypothetical protein A7983_05790 [Pectobacterium wasabiae CFBP 3304]EJS95555.1 Hypothetical protein Y17_1133 [Pectobacterium wasabiae CFBP 3304]KFX04590.1 hypothetical protein JV38_15860 [Pectobacterium wasabiae]KGA27610.1 hypothetical protein KU73_15850 [Pectobacterium wasabiae]
MKKILLLIGILLGMGGTWLYQWMKPSSDDPYFFLNPKPNYIGDKTYPIEKDIDLSKKGGAFDFIFWDTPQQKPKILYLFPLSSPSPHILLKVKNSDATNGNSSIIYTFKENKDPVVNFELYKIKNDLTEELIEKKIISNLEPYTINNEYLFFYITDQIKQYGQYRIHIDILNDNKKLNGNHLTSSIYIEQRFLK